MVVFTVMVDGGLQSKLEFAMLAFEYVIGGENCLRTRSK